MSDEDLLKIWHNCKQSGEVRAPGGDLPLPLDVLRRDGAAGDAGDVPEADRLRPVGQRQVQVAHTHQGTLYSVATWISKIPSGREASNFFFSAVYGPRADEQGPWAGLNPLL